MRKLILVALAAMALSSGAWAVCDWERSRYARCLKYLAGDRYSSCIDDRFGISGGSERELQKLRMQLEACLVEKGYYGR